MAKSTTNNQGLQLTIGNLLEEKPISIREPMNLLMLLMQQEVPLSVLQRRLYWLILRELKSSQVYDRDQKIPIPEKDQRFTFHYSELYSGHTNQTVRDAINEIHKLTVKIQTEKANLTSVTVFPVAHYESGEGTITVDVHRYVIPLMLRITEGYSSFVLYHALKLSSDYAQLLFSLLSRFKKDRSWQISIAELRPLLGAKNVAYDRYHNFQARVIDIALKQINTNTNLKVTYNQVKKGKSVVGLNFQIQTDEAWLKEEIKREVQEYLAKPYDEKWKLVSKYLMDYDWSFTLVQKNQILQSGKNIDTFLRTYVYILRDESIQDYNAYMAKALFQASADKK
ncbi:replication initiation protein [Larkinella insperata]|uniref:Replication initiation protein n=1 Tax=Larkinella insperata TaxID=332158 RepID=A0ABW3QGV9_9BACT